MSKEKDKESYTRFLILSYCLLAIAACSAAFAYFSSLQNEINFALTYLALSTISVIIFVLARLYVGVRKGSNR